MHDNVIDSEVSTGRSVSNNDTDHASIDNSVGVDNQQPHGCVILLVTITTRVSAAKLLSLAGSDEVANDTPLMDTGLDRAKQSQWKHVAMRCWELLHPVPFTLVQSSESSLDNQAVKWHWSFVHRVLKNRCVLQDSLSAVQFRNDLTRDFNVKLFSAKNCFAAFYAGLT